MKKKLSILLPAGVLMITLVGAILFLGHSQMAYRSVLMLAAGGALIVFIGIWCLRFLKHWHQATTLTGQFLEDKAEAELVPVAGGMFSHLFLSLRQIILKWKEASALIHQLGEEASRPEMHHLQPTDSLGKAIIEVQEKMKRYRDEEDKRTWGVRGMAHFSDLLRSQDTDLKEYTYKILSQLVKYIGANQGGLYLLTEDEQGQECMELTAAYAYERRKFLEKRIYPGQGLVGQAMLEKEVVYLTDIPKNYVNITSGLGEATPRNIVIIPLIVNETFQGALEIATFEILQPHEMKFLTELATGIASSLSNTRINQRTQKLLQDSQALTNELQNREEEMRQNMEELTATQEEMLRKQAELDSVFSAIDHSLITAEFDMQGNFLHANQALLTIYGQPLEFIKARHHQSFFKKVSNFEVCWGKLKQGENCSFEHEIRPEADKVIWLSANYTPVKGADGTFYKVLMLAQNITQRRLERQEFERLSLVADNTDNSVVITGAEGLVEYVNKGFTKMTGYTLEEIKGKKPGAILQGPETNPETVARISTKLKSGEPIYEEILNYNKNGETYWVSLAINPVRNEEGQIYKFIAVQADITETKKNALDSKYKLEAIGRSNAIIEFDTEGNILEANENFLQITGYSREEIIGKHHRIFVRQTEATSAAYQNCWQRLANGEFINDEFERVHKTGKTLWLRGIYNPIYDIHGKPYKIVKFALDITQEKLLGEETQRQEAELKSHMEAINKTIASVEFGLDGIIRDCNEIYLGVTGFAKQEVLGKHYLDIIPESERAKPQIQLMWDSLREGKFFSGEYKQTDKDGHELWLNGTFNPIFDAQGLPYKVMLFAQFTTKEKEKQQELSGTVHALKNILPIIEFSKEGVFKSANDLFFQEFGYKRLDLRQRHISEMVKGTLNFEVLLAQLQEEEAKSLSLELRCADGNTKGYKVAISGIRNLEHQIYKVLAVLVEKEVKEMKHQKIIVN
jgi:PAS domain S-box-containing protein